MSFGHYLQKLQAKESLSAAESLSAFDEIFLSAVNESDIITFLTSLHEKGESTDEIRGAVTSMRQHALTIHAPDNAIDIVGTGGDGHNTLNISTAVSFVVAACGVPVAKHGNRSSSSQSGSSDLLAALGINLEPDFPTLEQCLAETNLCFLFAPRHHPAMRHVTTARKKIGKHTIFNLLGPLTNPANVKNHLIGVYETRWMTPMAEVLRDMGSQHAWLTHGHDGLDEISISGKSGVVSLKENRLEKLTIDPRDIGLQLRPLQEIIGGDTVENARHFLDLLDGKESAYREIVSLNAAAALVVTGVAQTLRQGYDCVIRAIADGAVKAVLNRLIILTNKEVA